MSKVESEYEATFGENQVWVWRELEDTVVVGVGGRGLRVGLLRPRLEAGLS